jgi:hypothetical protein
MLNLVDGKMLLNFKRVQEMEKIKIEWHQWKGGISQIYSNGLEYAFLSADNKQCCPFVFCKDFLQDCVWAQLYSKSASIFGFTFNPKKDPNLCLERTRLLVTNSADPKFGEKIEKCVSFLNQIEKALHLAKTTAYESESPPDNYKKCGVFLLEGSRRWQEAPPLVSLYTLLVRVGFVYDGKDTFMDHIEKVKTRKTNPYQTHDSSYLTQAEKGINLILERGYRKIFYIDPKRNYPEGASIGTLHGSSGIVGFTGGSTKHLVPYWHRESLNKKPKKKKPTTETKEATSS